MSGMQVKLEIGGDAAAVLQSLRNNLANRRQLHARIAGTAERFVKKFGRETTARQHASADRLGARPTKHLERAYASIEGQSDANEARLLLPRASRLRAAFGGYTIKPGPGKKYLTIPASAMAYGRRAKELGENLFFARVGPKRTLVLARKVDGDDRKLEVVYLLVRQATIKEDRGLIPFDALAADTADEVMEYLTAYKGGTTA